MTWPIAIDILLCAAVLLGYRWATRDRWAAPKRMRRYTWERDRD